MATVTRWRRYGKDRLYVNGEDGAGLGYRDLLTGQDHVDHPDRFGEFRTALGGWPAAPEGATTTAEAEPVRSQVPAGDVALGDVALGDETEVPTVHPSAAGPTVPAGPEASEPTSTQRGDGPGAEDPVIDADWEDLAERRAGAMARERAQALKRVAPVRTFLARVLGVHTDERAWRIGAEGEEKVAAQLEEAQAQGSPLAIPARHPGRETRQ